MVSPQLFGDKIENVPLEWDSVEPYTFKDVIKHDPESIVSLEQYSARVSYEYVSYISST